MDEVPGTSHGTKMRPHEANIQPGTLFSYVPLVGPAYGHFKDRWLVVEVSEPSVQAGIGATYTITAVNQWGRLTRMNLHPTDRIMVLSEAR